jgi:hypothetical protein
VTPWQGKPIENSCKKREESFNLHPPIFQGSSMKIGNRKQNNKNLIKEDERDSVTRNVCQR